MENTVHIRIKLTGANILTYSTYVKIDLTEGESYYLYLQNLYSAMSKPWQYIVKAYMNTVLWIVKKYLH